MLQVVLELVDFHPHFLFLCILKINFFVVTFELLVVLRVILLKLRFLLFKVDAGSSKLLPQLFHINCAYREGTSHRVVRLRLLLL